MVWAYRITSQLRPQRR